MRRDLETERLSSLEMSKLSQSLAYKVSTNLARKFPKWKVIPDVKESKLNLFYMGNGAVNVEYQITVLSDGSYSFFFMGQPRNLNLGQNDILQKVHDKNQLNVLMKSLEKFQICPGICAENYLDQLPESNNTQYTRQLMVNLLHLLNLYPEMFTNRSYDLQSVAFLCNLQHVAQLVHRQIIT